MTERRTLPSLARVRTSVSGTGNSVFYFIAYDDGLVWPIARSRCSSAGTAPTFPRTQKPSSRGCDPSSPDALHAEAGPLASYLLDDRAGMQQTLDAIHASVNPDVRSALRANCMQLPRRRDDSFAVDVNDIVGTVPSDAIFAHIHRILSPLDAAGPQSSPPAGRCSSAANFDPEDPEVAGAVAPSAVAQCRRRSGLEATGRRPGGARCTAGQPPGVVALHRSATTARGRSGLGDAQRTGCVTGGIAVGPFVFPCHGRDRRQTTVVAAAARGSYALHRVTREFFR